MHVVVVGAGGRTGGKILEVLKRETDHDIIGVTRHAIIDRSGAQEFDPTSRREWRRITNDDRWRPGAIINAAGFTDVDQCEVNRERAWRDNVTLIEHLLDTARRAESQLIQLSTDHVFDGTSGPYAEDDTPQPRNYYGRTKLAAENLCRRQGECAILRTMWLYGTSPSPRPYYSQWAAAQLRNGATLSAPTDELGNPTLIDDLAFAIVHVIDRTYTGVLNIAGPDLLSRFEFLQRIATEWSLPGAQLLPTTSAGTNRIAHRPLKSGLISFRASATLDIRFTGVEDGLRAERIQTERRIQRA
jgi:dTDP-4-dehydrorhamnose reductase